MLRAAPDELHAVRGIGPQTVEQITTAARRAAEQVARHTTARLDVDRRDSAQTVARHPRRHPACGSSHRHAAQTTGAVRDRNTTAGSGSRAGGQPHVDGLLPSPDEAIGPGSARPARRRARRSAGGLASAGGAAPREVLTCVAQDIDLMRCPCGWH
ncbi:MAG: hypothetical protein ACRDTE_18875 [Pseudonocardiaceae bacterium]